MLKQILEELNVESDYLKLYDAVNKKLSVSVFGTLTSDRVLFLSSLKHKILLVAENAKEAQNLKEQFVAIGKKVDVISYKLAGYIYHTAEKNDSINEYYETLFNLVENNAQILIITPEILLQKLPKKSVFKENILSLSNGIVYDLDELTKKLIKMGYKRQAMVETEGDFSLRGDILDIFPTNATLPYRVQFYFDEVENIKTFNAVTYTTINEVKEVQISPNTLIFIEDDEFEKLKEDIRDSVVKSALQPNYLVRLNNIVEDILLNLGFNNRGISLAWALPFIDNYSASILDYFGENDLVVFNSTKQILAELELNFTEFEESIKNLIKAGEVVEEHKDFYFSKEQIFKILKGYTKLAYHDILTSNNLFKPDEVFSFKVAPTINYSNNYNLLVSNLKGFLKAKDTVILCAENSSSSVYLQKFLKEKLLDSDIINTLNQLKKGHINIFTHRVNFGAIFKEENLVVIGSSELFGKKTAKKVKNTSKKTVFTMPKVGDYVVHEVHGIGLCVGIERLKLSGYEKDYILIEYAGGDMLYLPSEQVELISSFVGSEKEPKLNKLGGNEFAKVKARVKESVKTMAFDLLKLYAEREKAKGFKFETDSLLQEEFEKTFPYTETEDQIKAINDIKSDMESGKIMDRLICGDVGYGKTEVALRGAFKAVLSGKQVAFLAPTTILAEQHYNTCVARMKDFMVNVESLSRFKTAKEAKQVIDNLSEGKIDVLCGTHRMLSKDVKFKDLGLLILDEEQRFGVADKEKIKELKKNVDVITMSATPIPRTLHMSMIGIRDISLIDTPPSNRLPIQTYVTEYSNALLIDAVNREMLRGGQVLVINNRIDTIYSVFEKLKALLPRVKMKIAHGQMDKKQLENTIKELYDGKIELLLATTLIENGIDLPNANTLVVLDSDKLGLSQLYQLRGRIGRSDRLGHAYFTYEKEKALSETAYKRLQAINEFTELGSGFKIALRDLEIRGAGNILGREQHGHMERVGYDMYCKILGQAVSELKGEKNAPKREVKLDIDLNAYIPSSYIDDDENRFRVYSNLAEIESEKQKDEVVKNIEDIYGKMPESVINLTNAAFIKNLAVKVGLKRVIIHDNKCLIEFYDKDKVLSAEVNSAIAQNRNIAVLRFEDNPVIEFDLKGYSVAKKQDTILKFLILCL
ncbi:MAG: transcription-repair coupling factor [Spirochaetales bacterium]